MSNTHRIIFQPMGIRAEAPAGTTLRAAARQVGVSIDSICGERATCGKCKIIVQHGRFPKDDLTSRHNHLSPPQAGEIAYWEKRRQGIIAQGGDPNAYRLSCQAQVQGDLMVMVPESSRADRQVVRKAAGKRAIEVRPALRQIYVELAEPTLADPSGDWERLKAALINADPLTRAAHDMPLDPERLTIALPALQSLSAALREGDWAVTATIRDGHSVIRIEPGYTDQMLGMAVDVGTTTIAAHLCDLHSGAVLATAATMNPQVAYGEDIMSRISHALEKENGTAELETAVRQAINRLARRAARQAGTRAKSILDLVIVGNTAMHHFLLGLSTAGLGRAPYVPALHTALDLPAHGVGITAVHPAAQIHVPPLTASFVGADNTAVLLAEAPHRQDECWLIVDVGTNAELVLGNRERLICTSTPTGPAFEGAHVEYGMRAAPGAIERVQIDPETLIPRFKVIGSEQWSDAPDAPPALGICGSGIIDAVAELYRVGLIGTDGRFTRDTASPHLRQSETGLAFILAEAEQTKIGRAIPITQDDVRQIQLAKAPLYVAAHYLLHAFGRERPDRILLAGGFGSHINPEAAMLLGMIPDCPLDRVHAVGNAAGDGARIALLNRDKRHEAIRLSAQMERIELPAQTGFQDQFTLALHLPHMVDPYPHLDGLAPPRETDPMVAQLFSDKIPTLGDA